MNAPRFTLSCTKTGRRWVYFSEGQCRQVALLKGLKDYEIERNEA